MPACSSQRGVGCTHVVKPPFVIRYFFGPIFSTVSPKKYTSVSWLPRGGGASAPGRACCWAASPIDDARRVVERAEIGLRVEVGAIGRDAVVALGEHDVAGEITRS